ncbi:MAG: hypothetical protein OXH12_03210 [Chloroflexi bacterium]|nr:hypothetical protein [Chloroflexota bacterium]
MKVLRKIVGRAFWGFLLIAVPVVFLFQVCDHLLDFGEDDIHDGREIPRPPWDYVDPESRVFTSAHWGPAWGRDGDREVIVFAYDEGRGSEDRGNVYGGSIYVVRASGGGLKRLSSSVGDGRSRGGYKLAYDVSPDVSPDGKTVAYATLRHAEQNAQMSVVTVGVNGGGRRKISTIDGSFTAPVWSAGGERIAVVGIPRVGNLGVYVVTQDGSEPQSITPWTRWVRGFVKWSPDGTRLALVSNEETTEDGVQDWLDFLFTVDADGSNVVEYGRVAGTPEWSPDGRTVAFNRDGDDEERGLYFGDTTTGDVTKVSDRNLWHMAWSPDGRVIWGLGSVPRARPHPSLPPLYSGLWEFEVSTHERRNIDDSLGQDRPSIGRILGLQWSPDGSRVAIVLNPSEKSSGGNQFVLMVVAADGSDRQVLVRSRPEGGLTTDEPDESRQPLEASTVREVAR